MVMTRGNNASSFGHSGTSQFQMDYLHLVLQTLLLLKRDPVDGHKESAASWNSGLEMEGGRQSSVRVV